ncbi:glycosyltransferase involved in cell wall biosynthesis [Thermocatellispora tengchongensis]|uniref:Glycosyltransferase involved in cell wall biosynthesis n=1 Tax=Thermocatellispora tengchongensis TaxID=1073253 RepID=A0A840P842_9ACTN|nr:glycosyltransferase family 4 protein [Thermocatellispora tengchongensis]MBB5134776.1 glycosyltransferase involved in cell wall biosynthesis [Thermocatellispora tengchongensis]
MRVCVGTVVHHPEDARIMHRQIRALLAAGHEVTYVAPFTHCNVTPAHDVRPIDVPRAVGVRRRKALRAARKALRRGSRDADLLIVHDIELLLALPSARHRPPTVWDVHEDTAGALSVKGYLPEALRRALPPLVRRLEARAERRLHLILAEDAYQARFTRTHPVVRNTTYVPDQPPAPPGEDRVIYVGHLSEARGAGELVELARRLRPHGVRLDLVGAADPAIRPVLRDAQREGLLDWFGYVPNRHALRMAEGALAGLSLLHDVPNYRQSLPTKVIEYMARGVPVITTPLPMAASMVGTVGCGSVVPYGDVDAAVAAVLHLKENRELRVAMGARGHAEARKRYHWPDHAPDFVTQLEAWAAAPHTTRPRPHHRVLAA